MPYVYLFDISQIKNVVIPTRNLNNNRADIAAKFAIFEDRQRSIIAWLLLQKASNDIYGINTADLKLLFSKFGKPSFENAPFHFSISHSLNLVAVAISPENVGIDIEWIDYDRKLSTRLLQKYEIDMTNSNEKVSENFYLKWTQIETDIKFFDSNTNCHEAGIVSSKKEKDDEKREYFMTIRTLKKEEIKIIRPTYESLVD